MLDGAIAFCSRVGGGVNDFNRAALEAERIAGLRVAGRNCTARPSTVDPVAITVNLIAGGRGVVGIRLELGTYEASTFLACRDAATSVLATDDLTAIGTHHGFTGVGGCRKCCEHKQRCDCDRAIHRVLLATLGAVGMEGIEEREFRQLRRLRWYIAFEGDRRMDCPSLPTFQEQVKA